jgi:hypothetical protein
MFLKIFYASKNSLYGDKHAVDFEIDSPTASTSSSRTKNDLQLRISSHLSTQSSTISLNYDINYDILTGQHLLIGRISPIQDNIRKCTINSEDHQVQMGRYIDALLGTVGKTLKGIKMIEGVFHTYSNT